MHLHFEQTKLIRQSSMEEQQAVIDKKLKDKASDDARALMKIFSTQSACEQAITLDSDALALPLPVSTRTEDITLEAANLALQLEGSREAAVTLLTNEEQRKGLVAIAASHVHSNRCKQASPCTLACRIQSVPLTVALSCLFVLLTVVQMARMARMRKLARGLLHRRLFALAWRTRSPNTTTWSRSCSSWVSPRVTGDCC